MRWASRSALVLAAGLGCGVALSVLAQTPPSSQTSQSSPTSASSTAAATQTSPTPQPPPLAGAIASHANLPAARPEDVRSVDALVAAVYDVISGAAGKPRDWTRFRSLFAPEARLGVVRPERAAANGQPARPGDIVFITPDMYVERDSPIFATTGFFEHAIANRVESFGNLAHVWSTYESRHAEDDKQPFARGINSIQMIQAQGRWWIVSLVWDQEREGLVLPDKYLR